MPDNKVQLIIETVARGEQAFDSIKSKLRAMTKDADNFKLRMDDVSHLLATGLSAAGLYKIGAVLKDAIDTTEMMQNALRGLAGVARYAGEDIGQALDAATKLAADGLVDVKNSAQALQNLLSRGFSLDESIKLLERLKDAAAFNRQASLSMADAVRSATEGLKNETAFS